MGSEPIFPPDLIIQILCFLPIISLLRFKCVCKSWCEIIQGSYFIEKHRLCAESVWKYDCEEFQLLIAKHGLVVERSKFGFKYRIRNPMTKQVLDLPNPQIGKNFSIGISYLPISQNYELICFNSSRTCAYFKVLTIGVDLEWRRVDFPINMNNNLRTMTGTFKSLIADSKYFLARFDDTCEMCFLEFGSEMTTSIEVPRNLTFSDGLVTFPWNKNFSIVKLEEKNLLHGWVLEDYKMQKWDEKKIFLEFMNVYPDITIKCFLLVRYNWLLVSVDENGKHLLAYHFRTKKVYICANYNPMIRKLRTSLVYIKGMHTKEIDDDQYVKGKEISTS